MYDKIFVSGVWILILLWIGATIAFLPKAWKQHSGGAWSYDDNGNRILADPIPFLKTSYFLFWLGTTIVLAGFSIWIMSDY